MLRLRTGVVLPLALSAALLAPAVVRADPTVFAAASLKEALDAVAAAWVAQGHPRPVIAYAGTPALARQIEQGAPADVFVSADAAWMDWAQQRGLLRPGSRADLVGNRLVLVAPARAASPTLRLASGVALEGALGAGRLAVADVETVPAGRYARAALRSLGVWDRVADRLAQAESTRAALMLVARGEAPLGIVYASDARAEPRVRVVDTFDAASHPAIVYPVAVVARARSPRAEPFVAFLRSADAAALFAARGFLPPPPR
jgi:molybdate transport system substrate-binding protein